MTRILLAMLLAAAPAAAQEADVQAAAAAFAQGQRAQLRRDYARAAELFELADQSAPSPEALRSAIRNHAQAGQRARAATLASVAMGRYEGDRQTERVATPILREAETALGRVMIRCEPACALTLDGSAVWHEPITTLLLYVDPGEHRIAGSFSGSPSDERAMTLAAGQSETLSFTPPPAPEPEPEPVQPPEPEPEPIAAPARGGVHPAAFGVLAGVTAVGLGLTIWSGVDTLAARDAYVMSPTEQGYNDGVLLEVRTNALLFSTIAFGIASFVLAFFSDFGGGALVAAAPLPDGALAMVRWQR